MTAQIAAPNLKLCDPAKQRNLAQNTSNF